VETREREMRSAMIAGRRPGRGEGSRNNSTVGANERNTPMLAWDRTIQLLCLLLALSLSKPCPRENPSPFCQEPPSDGSHTRFSGPQRTY
jgi:hypothetical protein